jgi:hypothetical protein
MQTLLDPHDATPQVLFVRDTLDKLSDVTVQVIRFRSHDDAKAAILHNERVGTFYTMDDPSFAPFITVAGSIMTAYRWLYKAAGGTGLTKKPVFAPCTCGIIKGDCNCAQSERAAAAHGV